MEPVRRPQAEPGSRGKKMSAAVFALAGTLLGVLGTTLGTLLNTRAEDRRTSREALRAVCTDFMTNLMRIRQLCMEMYDDGYQKERWDETNRLLADAQAAYERFRIVADLTETQKAARLCVHHGYWLSRSVGQNPRGDWQEEHDALSKWINALLISVRRELGVRHFWSLYAAPREDLPPEPPVKQPIEPKR
jgi:hypothetical protein